MSGAEEQPGRQAERGREQQVAHSPDAGPAEHRLEHRSNLFVTATLYADSDSRPVKIRNMSQAGALVEGAGLPCVGSAVRLSRGSVTVPGDVVWLANGRAGLKFAGSICISDWLPSAQRNPRQQYVDEVVYQSRQGSRAMATSAALRPLPDQPVSSDRVILELVNIKVSLERVAHELASDPETPARHAFSLQVLDFAVQSLTRLAETVGSAKS